MSFRCGFAFVLWYWWLPRLCDDVCVTCDYPVFVTCDYLVFVTTSQVGAPILHNVGKSLSVWVRPLLIGPNDHMQSGYCVTHHSLLPMGRKGKRCTCKRGTIWHVIPYPLWGGEINSWGRSWGYCLWGQ